MRHGHRRRGGAGRGAPRRWRGGARDREGAQDVFFERGRLDEPTLSLAHDRDLLRESAPPAANARRARGDDRASRAALRDDLLAAIRPFFGDGAVRQEHVVVRARGAGA